MTLMTKDGIEIFALPPVAWCKCAKDDVEDIDECPIKNFDDTGDICVPELCEFYTEHISQAESEEGE